MGDETSFSALRVADIRCCVVAVGVAECAASYGGRGGYLGYGVGVVDVGSLLWRGLPPPRHSCSLEGIVAAIRRCSRMRHARVACVASVILVVSHLWPVSRYGEIQRVVSAGLLVVARPSGRQQLLAHRVTLVQGWCE